MTGTRRRFLGASFVLVDWQVMLFWLFGLVDRPSDRLYVRTIPLSGCMDRRFHYKKCTLVRQFWQGNV